MQYTLYILSNMQKKLFKNDKCIAQFKNLPKSMQNEQ